jgi:hypothetical protein
VKAKDWTEQDVEAVIQVLRAYPQEGEPIDEALRLLDLLDDDYTRWPWMVKQRVEEARRLLLSQKAASTNG